MIPVRIAMDAHAQEVLASYELFLPILRTFPQFSHSLEATRNV